MLLLCLHRFGLEELRRLATELHRETRETEVLLHTRLERIKSGDYIARTLTSSLVLDSVRVPVCLNLNLTDTTLKFTGICFSYNKYFMF